MKAVLEAFDKYLGKEGLYFECIVIGGAALIQLGIVTRRTEDVDLIDPEIPIEIKEASVNFALKNKKFSLNPEEWFNSGPESLKNELPKNWKLRLEKMLDGQNLILYTLGRSDFLKTKLFACCDRDEDFDDCVSLKPSKKELKESMNWVKERDTNELWPARVEEVFKELSRELGHE